MHNTLHGIRSKKYQIGWLKQHAICRFKIGSLIKGGYKESTKKKVKKIIMKTEQTNINETVVQIASEAAKGVVQAMATGNQCRKQSKGTESGTQIRQSINEKTNI